MKYLALVFLLVCGAAQAQQGNGSSSASVPPVNFGSSGSLTSATSLGSAVAETTANNDEYHDNVNQVGPNNSKAYWNQNITCTFTSGSATVTGCPTLNAGAVATNFLQEQTNASGNNVVAPGTTFPAGTTILSGVTTTGFTMSANALVNGPQVISIVSQCGNPATRIVAPTNNGLSSDGYEFAAVGSTPPGEGCQNWGSGSRSGAGTSSLIFYKTAFIEASYLLPSGVVSYTDIAMKLTHNANADYYANYTWTPIWINGQTGDIDFYNHLGTKTMTVTESSGQIYMPNVLVVGSNCCTVNAADRIAIDGSTNGALGETIYNNSGAASASTVLYWGSPTSTTQASATLNSHLNTGGNGIDTFTLNSKANMYLAYNGTNAIVVGSGGAVSMPSLTTSGTIAGSICATSAGIILYESGATGCTISLEELKRDIMPIQTSDALHDILALRPIDYSMKDAANGPHRLGFGAHQVNGVNPLLSTFDGKGDLQAFDPNGILAEAVVAIQVQQREINALFAAVVALGGMLLVVFLRRSGRRS